MMKELLKGIVLQSIGGFYYIEAAGTVYECKARGQLRHHGTAPVAGDRVRMSVQTDTTGVLEEILPRRNVLVRPPVANVDILVIVASLADPRPNALLLDKMAALAFWNHIEPVIVFSKTDLRRADEWEAVYRSAGFSVFTVTTADPHTADSLRDYLSGKVAAFTGNSGVGKSSILNLIDPQLERETGEISRKLGRGRHTTRSAVLSKLAGGGYLVDTAGFSMVDMEKIQPIRKEYLSGCFPEFEPFFGACRFSGCAHIHEPDCAVRHAVEDGRIARSRYDSYVCLYTEAQKRKNWETE